MTISRNEALEQQLDAIEASLNSLTGASITEAWFTCPIEPKRPGIDLAASWLKDCGVDAKQVFVTPHRSPNNRGDLCFVQVPGFHGELPEPWTLVEYVAINNEPIHAWTSPVVNLMYQNWRVTCQD